jgi:peptidoglycan/LPS O-acetylase OafA/YrhL
MDAAGSEHRRPTTPGPATPAPTSTGLTSSGLTSTGLTSTSPTSTSLTSSGPAAAGPSTPAPTPASPTSTSSPGSAPTGYLPGLDGLRGLAVLAVLAYHLWPSRLPAGFLGVTVFFVLSGFLITRLLVAEHGATSSISLRGFWTRRARRLLPASLTTLAVVAVLWMLEGWLTRAFAANILWSLADLANWHTLATGSTYGAAGIDSPVLHFWSLAIEEQCYFVLPLVVWVVLRWRRASMRVLGRVVAALLAGSLVYIWINRGQADLLYLSTFSRVAELLVGALVAVVVARRGALPTERAWPVLGVVAGVGLLVVMATTSLDDPVYASGGLVAAALLSVVVLVGATVSGPLVTILSLGPLRSVGRISYAVYLFHWPILMWFREQQIDGWYVGPVVVVATLALAAVSMALLEAPIRTRRRVVAAPRRLVAAVALTIVVVCAFGVVPTAGDLDFATAEAQFEQLGSATSDPASAAAIPQVDPTDPVGGAAAPSDGISPTPATGPPVPLPRPTVMVFGDSTALMLGLGLLHTDVADEVPGFANVGCPVTRGGSYRLTFEDHGGKVFQAAKGCDWSTKLPKLAGTSHPQLVLFSGGLIDTVPRKLPALGSGWHTVDEVAYQQLMLSELEAAVDAVAVASPGTRVVLLTLSPDWKRGNVAHRQRVDIVNQVIQQVADQRPGSTEVVDLKRWLDATGERERLCPDGLHLVPDTTAVEVFDRFLGPRLRQIAAEPVDPSPTGP